ncbi:hypothetical protein V8668_23370 (plasmid) [Salmonella enterica subsp. enterica serovar Mbandaka]|uniref:hypothetical protein n=1 Tax=Salmonella enterica TaxID=28901 RepID=UPI00346126CC
MNKITAQATACNWYKSSVAMNHVNGIIGKRVTVAAEWFGSYYISRFNVRRYEDDWPFATISASNGHGVMRTCRILLPL